MSNFFLKIFNKPNSERSMTFNQTNDQNTNLKTMNDSKGLDDNLENTMVFENDFRFEMFNRFSL